MTEKPKPDGGYYAIKGFAYQIDKTILELFDAPDENSKINIEQIEDIDSNTFVMQVKYKETAKLTSSRINTAISNLIKEFEKDMTKKYILYAFFKDTDAYEEKIDTNKNITKETLNSLLGSKNEDFDEKLKEEFIKKFYLDLSPNFQTQFENVLTQLKKNGFGKTNDQAIFYYANITDYLYKKIVLLPPSKKAERDCTKKELFQHLKKGENLVFNSGFREYQGSQKYFKHIKKRYFSKINADYHERFIVLEIKEDEKISSIKEAIHTIIRRFYIQSGTWQWRKIKSPAPYVLIKNISDEKLIELKRELAKDNITFKDGHDYSGSEFSIQSVMEKCTPENKISLKIINNEEILKKLCQETFSCPKKVYQFYTDDYIKIDTDIKNVKIHIEEISELNSII